MSRGLATRVAAAASRSAGIERVPRRWAAIAVAIAMAMALVVAVIALRSPRDGDISGTAIVTTSSTAPGFAAPDVVSGSATAPGAGWQSDGQTSGAWIGLSWPQPQALHQMVIMRNPLDEPGVTDGFLSFGDGSFLQVRLSATDTATTIAFSPRSTDRVRFTASAVSAGARSVTIVKILVNTGDSDVVSGDTLDGNAASMAALTQSADSGASDAHALQDGSGVPGVAGVGAEWTVERPQGAWVQMSWVHPRELSSVELVGSTLSAAAVAKATLTFSDGVELPIGAVSTDPARPTIVAFMPRVATSVRLSLDRVSGLGSLTLGELRFYERGATPARPPSTGSAEIPLAGVGPCVGSSVPPTSGLVVDCPQAGSAVDDSVDFRISTAAGYTSVTASAWPADPGAVAGAEVHATPDASGAAQLRVDVAELPAGPLTVGLAATGPGHPTKSVFFPLYRRGSTPGDVASSVAARGRTLAYAEEFDRPVSFSRTGVGADYASGKPTATGAEDFGDAIFADPAQGGDNIGVVDDRYLRIAVEPSSHDPQGWGRTHVGGMLASARPGGSGFSAQYGYFEARMLVPAAPGTWPAFWMLPSDGLVAPTGTGSEIDAVEFYGHDQKATCHTTHRYEDGKNVSGVERCGQRFLTDRAAMAWHTYGVSITPSENVFFIDGQVVATAPQVAHGGSPMFFLVDFALGAGWPVDLTALGDRTTLYVDYVRVYV